ncbi:MAG TPA: DUF3106 domain-containing protein [Thiobacillaceae bacterium]|nr:DUF3106 domain-containing protein [Thiobacillaceae bacterium]
MKTATALLILIGAASLAQAVRAETYAPWERGGELIVAQMSPAERSAMRERWERMPPDERAVLREQFQERIRTLPPEERELQRRELIERWRSLPPGERELRRREMLDEHGYGRGFETRDIDEGQPDWGFGNSRRGRGR